MLFGNPVPGVDIRPDKKFYPTHEKAVFRPSDHPHVPLVTQGFGPTDLKVEPTVIWPGGERDIFDKRIRKDTYENFHRGIDISKGGCGADVLAAGPGKVIFSDKDDRNTEIIVINHGKVDGHRFETIYAHMEPRIAQVGDHVVTGTVIGVLGDSGQHSTGCHLHFAVRKGGRPVDPWRRLLQNTSNDPDVPATTTPAEPVPVIEPVEVPDVPIPASDEEYLAGQVAIVGNATLGARVRNGPDDDAVILRTIPGGQQETWLPTCWVIGDVAFNSDRWLTRWNDGQWEFTHHENVRSVASL